MQAAPRNLSMMNYHRHQSSLIWRFHCRLRDGPREFLFALIYGIMLRSDRHHQNGTKPQRLRESAREKSLQLPTVNFLRKIPEKLFYHLRWYQVDSHDSSCGMWQRCLHMIHRRDDPFTFFFFVPQNGFTIVLEKSRQGPHEATWFFVSAFCNSNIHLKNAAAKENGRNCSMMPMVFFLFFYWYFSSSEPTKKELKVEKKENFGITKFLGRLAKWNFSRSRIIHRSWLSLVKARIQL